MIQVADGCLGKQIAHGIRIATVKMHRRRAMKKTNALVRFRSSVQWLTGSSHGPTSRKARAARFERLGIRRRISGRTRLLLHLPSTARSEQRAAP